MKRSISKIKISSNKTKILLWMSGSSSSGLHKYKFQCDILELCKLIQNRFA